MKNLFFILSISFFFASGLVAQTWQTVGANFLSPGDIATNLQVLSYQDTAFVAYADMNTVKLKKRAGNNWVTVVNQNTENNYFKLIYGKDNKPYFVTLSRGASIISVGSTGFFADIHEYDNGSLTLVESREMLFVPSGTNMGLDVTNFDFTIRPNGDMAGIIRYPSSARSVYNVKIGTNPWFSETVYYGAIGGTSGNAIERSKLTFFDEGVIIASKWVGGSSGVIHLFRHDNNSSIPISTAFDNASAGLGFSVGSGVNPIKITAKNDTVFLSHTNNANNAIFRNVYYDATATSGIGTAVLQTFPSNTFGLTPVFTNANNYMIYLEEDPATFDLTGYITDLPANYALANGQLLGGTPFTLGELFVSPEVMSVDPSNGEVYVAYIHGPPMTQSIVRKFGCGAVTAAYNTSENELSVTSNYSSAATFEWTKCGESNVLSTDDTFEPTEDGEYEVTVTDGACEVTSNCITVVIENENNDDPVGINEFSVNHIQLFPNPATTSVTIAEIAQPSSIVITDLNGRLMYTTTTNETSLEIVLDNYASGVYLVNVVSEQFKATQKLIVK